MEFKDFKVEVCVVDEVLPHPNADRLSIYKVKGWQVVGTKEAYAVGSKVIYIPVDSILPADVELVLFPAESKIKLNSSRVRAIKIRQFVSQGMIVAPKTLFPYYEDSDLVVGKDIAEILGIKKYEPPMPTFQHGFCGTASKKNPNFPVYTKFPRIQNYTNMFAPNDEVIITEKIHGTNWRCGWVPFAANTWWQKLGKLLRLTPKWQFVYGSHYTQLSNKLLYKGYYAKNYYAEMVKKYALAERLPKGYVVYGEIYGHGIQKNYNYGLKDTRDLVVFDIQCNGVYLDYVNFLEAAKAMHLNTCPVLFAGKFKYANVEELVQGPSVMAPSQKVREGVMIKPCEEENMLPRKGAKVINPSYLLNDNSEFH